MRAVVLVVLAAFMFGCALIAVQWLWERRAQRRLAAKWEERERSLDQEDPVAPSHDIFEWRPRPAGTRDVAQAETVARVLYIVARDQPELFTFLRQDFAPEEAEGVIEILVDRRQSSQRCEADGRDARRNGSVSVDLREIGFTFARQQAPFQRIADGR